MVTKLHKDMGRLIRENVLAALPGNDTIHIAPIWYAIGNILPDISPLPLLHPHYAAKSVPYIYKKLMISLVKHRRHHAEQFFFSPIFSLRLGIISHYLCDFFCVAHQGEGIDGAKRHLNYEHEMRDFYYENQETIEALCRMKPEMDSAKVLGELSFEKIIEVFSDFHAIYKSQQSDFLCSFQSIVSMPYALKKRAYMTDILAAISCCTYVLCAFSDPIAVPA